MEFFGMGSLEILLILIVGLIILGPDKLPQIAKNLGKGIAALKKATSDITAEVTKEFEGLEKEAKTPSKEPEEEDNEASKTTRQDTQQ